MSYLNDKGGNLTRPGGNLTGLLLYEEGITGEWLAMLKEITPQLSRAALIANPSTTPADIERVIKSLAASRTVDLDIGPPSAGSVLCRPHPAPSRPTFRWPPQRHGMGRLRVSAITRSRCSRVVALGKGLRTKFPAREFRSAAISASNQRANSKACSQIPYAAEQGIFAAIAGNFFGITGKFNRASSEIAELLSESNSARLLMSTPGT